MLQAGELEEVLAVQPLPQRLGEIRHLVKRSSAPVQPDKDLLCAEGRFPQLPEGRLHFGQRHGLKILLHECFLILQIKNPSVSCLNGRSVSIPSFSSPKPVGAGIVSGERSGCSFKNASATASFSRRSTVQVL